ncbi:carbamoylphosphate synthase large subunit [Thermomonospora umbrina]|uniref:Carbamoylphosphate synthase large subunit n=1 Tax=Thermomonospora umbrina TaxID=111806 RepID=A0A3D9SKL8_9ACTN|nr:carbamoylphosphate synthase large subunit [Thermomonospora umbrina]
MPRRKDLRSVLVIGSGPVGTDHAGARACRALRAAGLRVIVVAPDSAAVMTSPETADATYLEPVTVDRVERVIARERPDALLPTMGGPAALDVTMTLHMAGTLTAYGVEPIGADAETIGACAGRGRPAALGGPAYEVEVLRDGTGRASVVCSIEHFAEHGISVVPAFTRTEGDLLSLHDLGLTAAGESGVRGSCTVRFAVIPGDGGDLRLVQVVPRLTRSSALASAATGLPVAEIAARLAIGCTLEEVVGGSPGTALEHVTVGLSRSAEMVALGRTLPEALRKAGCSEVAFAEEPFAEEPDVMPGRRGDPIAAGLAAAAALDPRLLAEAKRHGFSDAGIAALRGLDEGVVREVRQAIGIRPAHRSTRDGGALYSGYGEALPSPAPRERATVIIVGPGADGTGSGRSCASASSALRDAGYETAVVTSHLETLADPGCADRLYAEPVTLEHVLEVVHAERRSGPVAGVIVQFGGESALRLARALADNGVPVVGTAPEAIDRAGDHDRLGDLPTRRDPTAPADDRRPHFATEVAVDTLYDGEESYIGGVLENVEATGGRPDESACALPPVTLGRGDVERLRASAEAVARAVGIRGLLGVRFAVAGEALHVLGVFPGASPTVPFVSTATATPLAAAAARIALGGDHRRPSRGRRAAGTGRRRSPARGRPHRRAQDRVGRRGHGGRRGVRRRLRRVAGGRAPPAADQGAGLPVRRRRGSASDDPSRAPAGRVRLRTARRPRPHGESAAQRRRGRDGGRVGRGAVRAAPDRAPPPRRTGRPRRPVAGRRCGRPASAGDPEGGGGTLRPRPDRPSGLRRGGPRGGRAALGRVPARAGVPSGMAPRVGAPERGGTYPRSTRGVTPRPIVRHHPSAAT